MKKSKRVPKVPYAALRRLLKKLLDDSYDGCQDGCIHCGGINEMVCFFIDDYIKKLYTGTCGTCGSRQIDGECKQMDREAQKKAMTKPPCRHWKPGDSRKGK